MKKIITLTAMLLAICTVSAQTNLSYKFNQPVSYLQMTKIHQVIDVMGQNMDVNVEAALGCTLKAAGKNGNTLKVEVRIDTLGQMVDSPNGRMGGTDNSIAGKTFMLEMSHQGKITDLSEAKKVTYTIPGSEPEDISGMIIGFVPVLPAGNIKPGHTWSTTDTISTESKANKQYSVLKSDHTFEGFDSSLGINCAKITSVVRGTSLINTSTQGMEIKTSGDVTGTVTSLIDHVNGVPVKIVSASKLKGQMEMTFPENAAFPVTMDINTTTNTRK
jgi:hypothetical protein